MIQKYIATPINDVSEFVDQIATLIHNSIFFVL